MVTIRGTAPPIEPGASGAGKEDSRILAAMNQLLPGSRRMDLDRIGNTGGKSRFILSMTIRVEQVTAAKAKIRSAFEQAAPGFSIEIVDCEPA